MDSFYADDLSHLTPGRYHVILWEDRYTASSHGMEVTERKLRVEVFKDEGTWQQAIDIAARFQPVHNVRKFAPAVINIPEVKITVTVDLKEDP